MGRQQNPRQNPPDYPRRSPLHYPLNQLRSRRWLLQHRHLLQQRNGSLTYSSFSFWSFFSQVRLCLLYVLFRSYTMAPSDPRKVSILTPVLSKQKTLKFTLENGIQASSLLYFFQIRNPGRVCLERFRSMSWSSLSGTLPVYVMNESGVWRMSQMLE